MRYDPRMVADLPEVGRRFFARAIEPGTPLHRVVVLEMAGTFILNGMPSAVDAASSRQETDQISMALGHDFVLTFQERPGDCFEPVHHRLRSPGAIFANAARTTWPMR